MSGYHDDLQECYRCMRKECVCYTSADPWTDNERYENWFKSTPEYWSVLTNEITAKTINSGGKDRFGCKGEIEKCGVSCCHKKDVHDCEKCSPHVAFECRPMCKKCVAKGRDTCRCK
jgi:hypothetical protein